MKGSVLFLFLVVLLVHPVFAQATYSMDEIVHIDPKTYEANLRVFEYEKGAVDGNNEGLKSEDILKYYPSTLDWRAADIDGDGRDEMIHLDTTPYVTDLKIYGYEKGVVEGRNVGLMFQDALIYHTPTTSWLMGDIDGDGKDEFIHLDTTTYETNLRIYQYEKGVVNGTNVGLNLLETLTYYTPTTDWIAGDIDGDGKDELIHLDTTPYVTTLNVYKYENGAVEGRNVGLRLQDTLTYYTPTTSWVTGDIDGDGKDELIHIDTTAYKTNLKVYGYKEGFTQGNNVGIESEDTLVYFTPTANWLIGDFDRVLRITDYSPMESTILLDEGDPVSFAMSAYQSDGIAVGYQWTLDGQVVSSDATWTYSTDYESAGGYQVVATVTDGKGALTREWELEVANNNRPPTLEVTSPEDGASVKGTLDVSWKVNDPDESEIPVSMEYKEGIKPWVQVGVYPTTGVGSYTWDTTLLANGNYKLSLTAIDSEGKTDEVSISVTIANPVQQSSSTSPLPPPTTIPETPPPTEIESEPEEEGVAVSVRSLPDGAMFWVDDEVAGTTNTILRLEPGTYWIDVNKQGYLPRSRPLSVGNEPVEFTVIMVPEMAVYGLIGLIVLVIVVRLALFLRTDKIEKKQEAKPPEEEDDFSDVEESEGEDP